MIELLAILAIIGILTAVILPVLDGVRERARATQSIGNKRSIYTAFSLYQAEHNMLPPLINATRTGGGVTWDTSTGWSVFIVDYLDSQPDEDPDTELVAVDVLLCPAAETHNVRRGDYGVAYNEEFGPIRKLTLNPDGGLADINKRSYSISELNFPSKTPLIADCEQPGAGGVAYGSWYFNPRRTTHDPAPSTPSLSYRHGGKVQMVFADGRIDSFTPEEMYDEVLPWDNESP